jgi:hypothetical protein
MSRLKHEGTKTQRAVLCAFSIAVSLFLGGCTQAAGKPDRLTANEPIEFQFINASISGIYTRLPEAIGWEIELIPNSRVAHKRMYYTETEETVTLSEDDMARINNLLTKARFFELPDRIGEAYADVGDITLYVESGNERKTIKTCPGQHLEDPQIVAVMELWQLIRSLFPNKE